MATDEDDALEVAKSMDIGADDDFQELEIKEVSNDHILTIRLDGYHPTERHLYPSDPYRNKHDNLVVAATVADWLTVHKRGDCIASSVY